MVHELKIWPRFFDDVLSGRKRFEVRKEDRVYRVGDLLALNEFDPAVGYTGRSCVVGVDCVFAERDFVKEGFVILGFRPCEVLWEDIEIGGVPLAASPFARREAKREESEVRE